MLGGGWGRMEKEGGGREGGGVSRGAGRIEMYIRVSHEVLLFDRLQHSVLQWEDKDYT